MTLKTNLKRLQQIALNHFKQDLTCWNVRYVIEVYKLLNKIK